MKKNIFLSRILICSSFYLASTNSATATVLSITPLDTTVGLSTSFSLVVSINDVTDLYAYQFDITFNKNLFQAIDQAKEGAFFSSGGVNFMPGNTDNTNGEITFIANSLIGSVAGVNGSGVLTSISFQSLNQIGTGSFTLKETTLLDSNLGNIDHSLLSANVTVPAVPEPEEWVLMLVGSGLTGFQVRRIKRGRINNSF